LGTAALATFTAAGRNLIDDADASAQRTTLGLAIGSNVQAYSATLAAVAGGTYTGAASITTLGTIATGVWNGTTIAVANGGTGATTASNARTNLGVVIGTDVAPATPPLTNKTDDYTLALTDANSTLTMSHATLVKTFIVPPNASVAFPIGTQILFIRLGAAVVDFEAGVGVTINSPSGDLEILDQYGMAALVKTDTNTWVLGGNV